MTELEFSRPVRISKMGKAGLEFAVEATPEECAALAQRLGISELKGLKAEVDVKHWRKGGAQLTAQASGVMVRNCVVTLEDFDQPFDEPLEIQFADPRDKIHVPKLEDGEMILVAEGEDPPEVLENDTIDVGEAIAQQLVLSMDPYPRKPGAAFEEIDENREETSPFSVLSALKPGSDEGPSKS